MITKRLLDDEDLLFLKKAEAAAAGVDPALVTRVSEMLLDLERGGEDALQRYARELDGFSYVSGIGKLPQAASPPKP